MSEPTPPYMASDGETTFCISIDYERQSENPARVFQLATELIHAFSGLDRELAGSVDVSIEPVIVLEDIEVGSLRIWLRDRLRNVDEEALKSGDWKRVVGTYLVKGKTWILRFLEDKDTLANREELVGLQRDLLRLAEETEIRRLPMYTPIDLPKIIAATRRISDAMAGLAENEHVTYVTADGEVSLNRNFHMSQDEFEDIFTMQTIQNKVRMILKVKKPDYLGMSMWEFRHQGHVILAKIADQAWLRDFQNRAIDVRPGDALVTDVLIKIKYGYDGEVVAERHEVLKVHGVLDSKQSQQPLFDKPNP